MLADPASERYASALFELATDQGVAPQIDAELRRVLLVTEGEPLVSRALVAPDVPQEVKRDICQRVFATGCSPLTLRFLHVLVEGRRFGSLHDVVDCFHDLLQQAQGKIAVSVETAVQLPLDLRKRVEADLSTRTQRAPEVTWLTNPEILGGVVIRIKDTLIDYSLKRQLLQMRDRLLQA